MASAEPTAARPPAIPLLVPSSTPAASSSASAASREAVVVEAEASRLVEREWLVPVAQRSGWDCGVACLAAVFAAARPSLPASKLRYDDLLSQFRENVRVPRGAV